MMSKYISRFKVGFAAAALVFVVTSQSCEEDSSVASCTGCNSTLPYSKPSAGTCYATLTACTNALGSGCVICY